MKALILSIILLSPIVLFSDPVCHRCELLREYHEKHPEENYYWYDDYLEESGKKNDLLQKNSSENSKTLPEQQEPDRI